MRKNSIYILIVILSLVSILASACGGAKATSPVVPTAEATKEAVPTQPPAPEQVTLSILHNWGPADSKGPTMIKIFNEFMAANPNIKIVQDVQVDADIATKAETAFLAGQEPDLIFNNLFPQTYKWLDTGLIVPVNEYIKEWGLDGKFKDEALQQWTNKDGKILGFPMEGYNWPFWYNTKIFKELNLPIPTTWDEIIADVPKIRAAGYEVVAAGGLYDSGFYTFSSFLIGSMTTAEYAKFQQEGHLASIPNAVKAIEQFVKAREAGVFPKDAAGLPEEQVNMLFYTGKAAIWQGGSWFYNECPEALRPDVVVGGVPLTNPTVWDKNWVLAGYDAKAVWITRNGAKKLDAVKKLIQFIYTPEHIGWFVEQAGMPPPFKEVKVDNAKLSSIFVQSLNWGDKYVYLRFQPGAAGVDTSKIFNELWLPTSTADYIIKAFDQAYLEGLGK